MCEGARDFSLKGSTFNLIHEHRPNTACCGAIASKSNLGSLRGWKRLDRLDQKFKRFEIPDSAKVAHRPVRQRLNLAFTERRKRTILDRVPFKTVMSKPFNEASAPLGFHLLTGRDDHGRFGRSLKHALLQAPACQRSEVGLGSSIPHPSVLQVVHIKDETDEWYEVVVESRGWVSKKFIKMV